MENAITATNSNANSAYKTVGELRKQYGKQFAEGYEDGDSMSAVLGRAGTASLGEYLSLYHPG